jgi:hypothetical protein
MIERQQDFRHRPDCPTFSSFGCAGQDAEGDHNRQNTHVSSTVTSNPWRHVLIEQLAGRLPGGFIAASARIPRRHHFIVKCLFQAETRFESGGPRSYPAAGVRARLSSGGHAIVMRNALSSSASTS